MTEAENELRKAFFAHRNGVVADALRAAGDPHRYIMGCQLADIVAIAANRAPDASLAQALWADREHRECRMAATMLYPVEKFTTEKALEWCHDVETTEIADVLCHRLLRLLPFALDLVEQLAMDNAVLVRYTAFRLLLNLLLMGKVEPTATVRHLVEEEQARGEALLQPLLASLLEEFAEA